MPRRRRRLKPILAILSLVVFLALGLSVRIFKGPYRDTSGLLTPAIPVSVTQRPPTVSAASTST